jgi:uncharacterized protein YjgD (DUF1641 family)
MVTTLSLSPGTASDQLLDRLSDPRINESLNRILDNIELIAFGVTALDGFLRRSSEVADSVAVGVAEIKTSAPNGLGRIIDLLPRIIDMLPQMTALVERLVVLSKTAEFQRLLDVLSNPDTLSAITAIMNNIEFLSMMITALDGFARRADTVADNVAAGIADVVGTDTSKALTSALSLLPQLSASMPKLIEALPQLIEVGQQLQPLLQSPEFNALMASGVFAPKTVSVVGQAGDALVESYDEHRKQPKSLGLYGLLRALNDPDVKRALGFAAEFGKQFGKHLQ